MISRISSLTYLALVAFFSLSAAAPFDLQRRGRNVLIGYRYVRPDVANAYIKAGRLTNVPASGVQLGQGAYLSPQFKQWDAPNTHWLCTVFADDDKFKNVNKMWIDQLNPAFNYDATAMKEYLVKAKMSVDDTIRFSKIKGKEQYKQMLIPPKFLGSDNPLGIKVTCVPKPKENSIGDADWGTKWAIPGWPPRAPPGARSQSLPPQRGSTSRSPPRRASTI